MTPPDLNAIVDRLAGPAILQLTRIAMKHGDYSREEMNANVLPGLLPAFNEIRQGIDADVRAVLTQIATSHVRERGLSVEAAVATALKSIADAVELRLAEPASSARN
jgi:hypothetical protein